MRVTLTRTVIAELPNRDADIYDAQQSGLVLRTRASGRHAYRVALGRGKWLTLGSASVLTPKAARALAQAALGDMAKGKDPREAKRKAKAATFDAFLKNHYEPWALAHLRSGDDFVARIRRQFSSLFGKKPLAEITPWAVEKWRSGRLRGEGAVAPGTVNRDLVALKACLSKAVQWRLIKEHPIRDVKCSKEDNNGVVRFLSADEEKRLRDALQQRDDRRRAARHRANLWRGGRGYSILPEHGEFTDHLTPLVLLALNTGLRRGELFNLTWADVDLAQRRLTVQGRGAKSGRTRHIPLNTEATAILQTWGPRDDGRVFPGDDGERMVTLKRAWLKLAERAELVDFRFHDLRHSFASKLVQRGVDLNTVRELLGHSAFALTLRYAHLTADNKAAAVAKLDEKTESPEKDVEAQGA